MIEPLCILGDPAELGEYITQAKSIVIDYRLY
jgi:hypothetical protein